MPTVISSTLRNEKMNVKKGYDLFFDANGVAEDVPFEIAKCVVPMHGFRVEDLSDEEQEEAQAHLDAVNAQRAAEVSSGVVRYKGIGTQEKTAKRAFTTSVVGREPRKPPVLNAGEKEKTSSAPAELPSAPAKAPMISGKKKSKAAKA